MQDSEVADIVQRFLDRQSESIFHGDLEAYCDTVSLPFRRLSLNHDVLIEDHEQVRLRIQHYVHTTQAMGIDLFMRRVQASRALGQHYVEGIYFSDHLRGATHMLPPYEGRVVLRQQPNGGWRMVESELQLETSGWVSEFSTVRRDDIPDLAFVKGDVRGLGLDPKEVYATFLAALEASERDNDFDAYVDLMCFPYTSHFQSLDTVVHDAEVCRPFFDLIATAQSEDLGNHITRSVLKAEFVGADMLVGYHEAYAQRGGAEGDGPIASRMILKFIKGRWRMIAVANAIRSTTFPFDEVTPVGQLPSDLDIQKRTTKWPSFLRTRTVTA